MKSVSGEYIDVIVLTKLLYIYMGISNARYCEEEGVKNFHLKQAEHDVHELIKLLEIKINE